MGHKLSLEELEKMTADIRAYKPGMERIKLKADEPKNNIKMSYTTEQMLLMAIDVAKEEMGDEFNGHTVGYTTQAMQQKDGSISESFFIVLRAEDGQYMASGSTNLNDGYKLCLEYFQSALREYKQTGFPCER